MGELLREAGLLTEEQLNAALAEQKRWGGRLGRILVDLGLLDERTLVRALAEHLRLPSVDLETLTLPPDVAQHLRVDLAEYFGAFPLGGDPEYRSVMVAMGEPTAEAIRELASRTGKRIQVFVAAPSAIERAIRHHYYGEGAAGPRPPAGGQEPRAPLPAARWGATAPDARAQLEALGARLAALERGMANQAWALQALLSLLRERGLTLPEPLVAVVQEARQSP